MLVLRTLAKKKKDKGLTCAPILMHGAIARLILTLLLIENDN